MHIQITKNKTVTVGRKPKPFDASRTYTPTPPTVNLVPRGYLEVIRQRQLVRSFGTAIIAIVVIIIASYVYAQRGVGSQSSALTDVQATSTALNNKIASLTPFATYYSSVGEDERAITTQMSNEVLFSNLNTALARDSGGLGVNYTALTFTADTASSTNAATTTSGSSSTTGSTSSSGTSAATSCTSSNPFGATSDIGCITVQGSAPSRSVLSTLLSKIDADKLFDDPFVSTSTTGTDGTVTFSATVSVTDLAYSHRYDSTSFILSGGSK